MVLLRVSCSRFDETVIGYVSSEPRRRRLVSTRDDPHQPVTIRIDPRLSASTAGPNGRGRQPAVVSSSDSRSSGAGSAGSRSEGRGRRERWAPTVAVAVVVLAASLVPVPGDPSGTSGVVGAVGLTTPFHVVGYAALAAVATRATGREYRGLLVAVALAAGFGFGVELLQATIAWRTFAWSDAAVNVAGAVIGVGIAGLGGLVAPAKTRND